MAKRRVQEMIEGENSSTTDLASSICEFMLEVVSSAGIKAKKDFQDGEKTNEPWFDLECKTEKERLRNLSKYLTKNPSDKNPRSQISDVKKNFRRMILAKKRRHRKALVDKLQHEKYERNLIEHLKIFRKISPKSKSDQRQPSMTEFRRYFEKLSFLARSQNIPPPMSTKRTS